MFKNFLEISVAMSFVIIFVFIISKMFNNKYKKKWRYFVWLFIAIRLLIPINIKVDKPVIDIVPPDTNVEITVPMFGRNIGNMKDNFNTVNENDVNDNANENTSEINQDLNEVSNGNTNEIAWVNSKQIKLINFIQIVWIAGMVISFLFYLINFIIFKIKIKGHLEKLDSKLFEQVKDELKIKRNVNLCKCSLINSPVFVGFVSPIILMPYTNYTDEELKLIYKHELTHFKRMDVWYKLILVIASVVHWFNPLVYLMRRYASKDIEYTCDDIVTKDLSLEQRKEYSKVILKTMENGGM
mgnify:CR=1 FL=1